MTGEKPLFLFQLCWKYLTPAVCTVSPAFLFIILLGIGVRHTCSCIPPVWAGVQSWCNSCSPSFSGHVLLFAGKLVSAQPGQRAACPGLGHRPRLDAHLLLCLSTSPLGHLHLLRHPRDAATGCASAFLQQISPKCIESQPIAFDLPQRFFRMCRPAQDLPAANPPTAYSAVLPPTEKE